MDFLQYQSQQDIIHAIQLESNMLGISKTYQSFHNNFVINITNPNLLSYDMVITVHNDKHELLCDTASLNDWLVILNIDEVLLVPDPIFKRLFYV